MSSAGTSTILRYPAKRVAATDEQWEGEQVMQGAIATDRLRAAVQLSPYYSLFAGLGLVLTAFGLFVPMGYCGPTLMAVLASVASARLAMGLSGLRRGAYAMLSAMSCLCAVAMFGYAVATAVFGDVVHSFRVWNFVVIVSTSVLGVSLTRLMSARMIHAQRRALDAASMAYGVAGCGYSLVFQLEQYGTPFFGRTPISVSWLVSNILVLCSTGFVVVIATVCVVYPRHRSLVTAPIAIGMLVWLSLAVVCIASGVVTFGNGDNLILSASVLVFSGVLLSARSATTARVVDPLRSQHPYLPIVCLVASGVVSTVQRRNTPQHDDALTFLICFMLLFIIVRSHMMTVLLSGLVSRLESQEERLTYQANVDELSGLSNRRSFYSALESELSQTSHDVTVGYIDLDRFKQVNDSYGHAVGDGLLRHISQSLNAALPDAVCVARIAGDEFAVVYNGPRSVDEWACDVLDSLCVPFIHDGRSITLTGSLGVATYVVGDEVPSVDELMNRADVCLYRAKESGRNRYVVYGDPPTTTPTTNCGHL